MCGIVGYTGQLEAAPVLLDGLRKLEYRGYDSAGIAVLSGTEIKLAKTSGRINKLAEECDNGKKTPGTLGIGHTRWATHGAPTYANAHPHLSNDKRFALVHNGIIENYAALREELLQDGYKFESETDTETVVHLLEKYYDGDMKTALLKTVSRLTGAYALGIVCTESPDTIYAVREQSPLIVGLGIGENYFASDVTALVSHTKNIVYLDDGEIAVLRPGSARFFDCVGNELHKEISRITWSVEGAEKGGFDHFMMKEMMEEPGAVRNCLAPRILDHEVDFTEVGLTEAYLRTVRKIVITACGSAYHAGICGKYMIEKYVRIPTEVLLASEFRYSDPIIDDKTLVIIISQSGETADTKAAEQEAKALGAKVLGIVNVVGSSIAKLADFRMYTYAGPEIAVATTKGFSTQVAALALFAAGAAHILGTVNDETYREMVKSLEALPSLMQRTFDINPDLRRIAERIYKEPAIFYIGRNTDYAISMEGALKMKEISYVHAEAYAAGELKHGTIALIEEGRPVVALCYNENIREKMVSNIEEVIARGAYVIAVAVEGDREIISKSDDVISIPKTFNEFGCVLEILPLQMLAYQVALLRGCDIDKPKNLAKSVTVE